MKITNVETIRLLVPLDHPWQCASFTVVDRTVIVVKIHTDEGIVGLGDAFHSHVARPEAIPVIVDTVFKPLLIGEDPFKIEYLWRKLRKGMRLLGTGGLGTLSGVDIALWDILGKALGAPVYTLLGGGKVPPRIEPYVGSQTMGWRSMEEIPSLVEEARSYVEMGYTALKFRGGRGLPDRREDIESIRALREAFGDSIKIMVDANHGYTQQGVELMAKEFERYNVFWLEDPIQSSSDRAPERYAQIASQVNIPIAVGGNLFGTEPLRKIIDAGGIDIVKMDASSGGGITEIVKMGHLAAAWDMKWAPVTHEPYGQLATLHAMAAAAPDLTSGMYIEWDPGWPLKEFMTSPPEFKNGEIIIPNGPGLGTKMRQEFLDRYQVDRF